MKRLYLNLLTDACLVDMETVRAFIETPDAGSDEGSLAEGNPAFASLCAAHNLEGC